MASVERVGMRWWEQADINLTGVMKAAAKEKDGNKSDGEDVKEDSWDGATKQVNVEISTNLGTESNVSLTSMKGVEHNCYNMLITSEQGGRSIRRRYYPHIPSCLVC